MEHTILTARDAPVGTTPKELVWRKNKARLYRYTRPGPESPATWKTPILLSIGERDFRVPIDAVISVQSEKVTFACRKLDRELRASIGHAHEQETR